MSHKNKMGSIIRSTFTVFYSHLWLNSRRGFNGLKYMYSVISVIVDSLLGNTKNRKSTRSWTARLRSVHSWAVPRKSEFESPKEKYFFCGIFIFCLEFDRTKEETGKLTMFYTWIPDPNDSEFLRSVSSHSICLLCPRVSIWNCQVQMRRDVS